MKKWMIWAGGIVAVIGIIWALLSHGTHANIINAITGISVQDALAVSHFGHRIEGWSAFIIGIILCWIGWKK